MPHPPIIIPDVGKGEEKKIEKISLACNSIGKEIGDINLYKFGMEIKKVAESLNRKTVVIASGDLSHKLKEEGPYSYSSYGEKFDNELLESLQKGDILKVFSMDKVMIEEAGQCGLNSIYILLGTMEGKQIKGELLSYEGPFGVGYGVMKLRREEINVSNLDLLIKNKEEKFKDKLNNNNPYVKLARENLDHYFTYGRSINDISSLSSELLNQKHGVFVSLKKFGHHI